MPRIARLEAEYDVYSDQINDQRSGYSATWSFAPVQDEAPAPLVLRPCGNPACADASYAVFTSEACRMAIEGPVDQEDSAYFVDATHAVLLGQKALVAEQAAIDGESLAKLVCGYR